MGMLDYGALKGRLTIANTALVALGTATFAATGATVAFTAENKRSEQVVGLEANGTLQNYS